ncbi:MAG: NUDIX hydrolase [Candidatus Peregrinibacteria bacterium GW2011_GWC2_39_14]|nr:MAG: NUDIX hydrolase [Candidatus Peregrinibacteria bacterium GW2011_GWA2_38_36]KKR06915.1 MAG: NUDIX hydrolase [Candidatus Peregrinibacteria bacterium GW2011_GWC2_39_14]
MKTWKTIKSKYVLRNKYLAIRKDDCLMENEKIAKDYFVIEKLDYAMIAAFTKENRLVMVEQYRHPVETIGFELPAGGLTHKNESIKLCAKRELLEETGYSIKSLKKIGEFHAASGILNNKMHLFIGYGAIKTHEQNLDENEQISPLLFSKQKVLKLLKQGKIKDASTALTLSIIINNNLWNI